MAADRSPMTAVNEFPNVCWYHGALNRVQAESILYKKSAGVFLVRDSHTLAGGYVLSVSENSKVSHYIITQKNGVYQIGDQTFKNLTDIVSFYRRHFLDTTTLVEAAAKQITAEPGIPGQPGVTGHTGGGGGGGAGVAPFEPFKVKARYNFPGTDSDDLPFKKNDVLTVIKEEEEQWWMARDCTGKEGMIPVNYVQKLTSNRTSGSHNTHTRGSRTSGMSSDASKSSPKSTSYMAPTEVIVPAIAEAIRSRHPTVYDESELKFEEGDKILVLEMPDSGSWLGQLKNRKQGTFPFLYVKVITSDPDEVSKFLSS